MRKILIPSNEGRSSVNIPSQDTDLRRSVANDLPPWKRSPEMIQAGQNHADIIDVPGRIDQTKRSLNTQISAVLKKIERVRDLIPQIKLSDAQMVDQTVEKATHYRQIRKKEALSRVDYEFETASNRLQSSLKDGQYELFPLGISDGWQGESLQVRITPMLSECVSIGNIILENDIYPALVPFNSQRGIYLSGEEKSIHQIAVQITGQLISLLPERNLAINVFDPTLTAVFGILSPLRQLRPGLFPVPVSQSSVFKKTLEDALGKTSACAERIVSAGAGSLKDLWNSNPMSDGELQLIIVLDYPFAVDAGMHDLLMRLSTLGPASGVQLILCEKKDIAPARDVLPNELRKLHTQIVCKRDSIEICGWESEDIKILPDASFDLQTISKLVSERAECSKNALLPTVALEDIISFDDDALWSRSSADSLDAAFGSIGKEDALQVAFRSENPPTANMLIGGAVGQGKSNLLLDIIYALSCAYSPDELELFLLDFKQGVEFKRFDADANGENYLPQARVLGIETNQTFGVAVLRYLNEELERRSALFKNLDLKSGQRGVNSIQQYRRETGAALPRILLIIDEFHRIFDGDRDRAETAVDLLEVLARQGRSFGIHLMLATQTISGISAMGTRKDAIFAQFPIRMSLKNTVQESQAILSNGNKAASELSFRGEVILNENTGMDPENSNKRGLAAYANPETLPELQARLWAKGHRNPPLLFNGSAFTRFPSDRFSQYCRAASEEKGPPLWLGQRIAVSDEPYFIKPLRDADQGIALVGSDDESLPIMPKLFHSMMTSAAPWLQSKQGEVLVLSGESDEPGVWMKDGLAVLNRRSIAATFIGKNDVKEYLMENMRGRINDQNKKPLLVFASGMQRIPGMDEERKDGDGLGAPRYSGRTVLQDLASKGAVNNIFFVGWWNNLQAVQADMGSKRSAIFCYITVKLGLDDMKSLVGTRVSRIEGHPRIGVYIRTGDAGLIEIVPYEIAEGAAW